MELPERPYRHRVSDAQTANRYGMASISSRAIVAKFFAFGGLRSASKRWKRQFGVALVCNGSPLLHGRSSLGFLLCRELKKKEISNAV